MARGDIEALESDYVEMARLKGVPMWRIVLMHALPNATAPTIQGHWAELPVPGGRKGGHRGVRSSPSPGIGQGCLRHVNRDYPGHPVHRRAARRVLRAHEYRQPM